MDGLSVSCKQLPDLSPWQGAKNQQGSLSQILTAILKEYGMFNVYNVAGIHN